MPSLFVVIILVVIAFEIWVWFRKPADEDEEGKCANCGYDLRASRGRCPECGTPFWRSDERIPLRDDWPADAISLRTPSPDEQPVVVHETDKVFEARLLRDQFDVRGIWARVIGPPVVAGGTGYRGRVMGSWRVVVWSGDLEIATELRNRLIPMKPAVSE